MQNFRLVASILGRPWLIDQQWVKSNLALIGNLLDGSPAAFEFNKKASYPITVEGEHSEEIIQQNFYRPRVLSVKGSSVNASFYKSFNDAPEGSLAVIPVIGAISKYYECGVPGSVDMARWVKDAEASDKISGIIFDFDTPGGMVDGTATFADAIKNATKPTTAFINDGMAASAGMWLASSADEIILSQKTDALGSIGVLTTIADYRGFFEQKGIKIHEIYAPQSSDKNKDYHDALEGDDSGIKADLAFIADQFIRTVKANRKGKLNLEEGNPFTGKMFFADEAIKIGLADRMGSIDHAVESTYSRVGSKENSKTSIYMFGNKYPKLSALKDKKAEEITVDECEAVTAELNAAGINATVTTQTIVDAHVTTETSTLAAELKTAKDANILATGRQAALETEVANLKAANAKLPANAGAEPDAIIEAEGKGKAEEPVNEFETSVDKELKERNAKLSSK